MTCKEWLMEYFERRKSGHPTYQECWGAAQEEAREGMVSVQAVRELVRTETGWKDHAYGVVTFRKNLLAAIDALVKGGSDDVG